MDVKELKRFVKEMVNCTQCGYCKDVCPVFDSVGWDSSVARAKMALAYGLYTGDIEPDESVLERLFQCTTCADCSRRCPSGTEVVEIVEAARRDLNEAGYATDIQKNINGSISKYGNPYGEERKRSEVLGEEPKKAKIAYFAGCTATYRNPEIAGASISILNKLGADYTILNETCCGSVLRRCGFSEEELRKLAEHNIDAIEETGAEVVLFSCAGCLRMFRKEYQEIRDFDFEPLHFTEWLSHQDFELKPLEGKATYHDPCHIGRHLDLYRAPREILERIPGLEFREMEHNEEEARCCGGGGGVRAGFPELSKGIARRRVKEADGMDLLLSTCPFCVNTLRYGNSEGEVEVEIKDLLEVIDELME